MEALTEFLHASLVLVLARKEQPEILKVDHGIQNILMLKMTKFMSKVVGPTLKFMT